MTKGTKRLLASLAMTSAAFLSACGSKRPTVEQMSPAVDVATLRAGERMELSLGGVIVAFRWAPAGSFLMGSPSGELMRIADEAQREVEISQGFWIAESPTSQALWRAVMSENPSFFRGKLNSKRRSVENVCWQECVDFVSKLNENYAAALPVGYKFALPTEAQWEYACRAGTTTPFSFGSTLNSDNANCDGRAPYGTDVKGKYEGKTTPVKSYPPNAWGLYDMHGNVWEWTSDLTDKDFSPSLSGSIDPTGSEVGDKSIVCGGGWIFFAESCLSASEMEVKLDRQDDYFGFRLALIPDFPSPVSETEDASEAQEEPSSARAYPSGDERESTRKAGALLTLTIAGVEVNFHWAPAGTFMMGAPEDDPVHSRSETPQHEVELTKGFWIAETETTQELWQAVMGKNPSGFKGSHQLPVETVSWSTSKIL